MTSISVKALSAGLYPLLLEDSSGSAVAFVTDTGALSCQGISSTKVALVDSLHLFTTNASIERSGDITGASITINGTNGISVYNGATQTASITQGGALTCSNISCIGSGGLAVGTGTGVNASITQAGAISGASISTTGNITASGTISSQGNYVLTSTYNPFYCAGQVNSSGNSVCSTGRYSFTSVLHSTGVYWITYSTAYPNSNYIITANSIGSTIFISIGSATSTTKAEFATMNSSNAAITNASFYFMVF